MHDGGKRQLARLSIQPATNGGFIIRQGVDNKDCGPSYTPDDELVFPDAEKALAHLASVVPGMARKGTTS